MKTLGFGNDGAVIVELSRDEYQTLVKLVGAISGHYYSFSDTMHINVDADLSDVL